MPDEPIQQLRATFGRLVSAHRRRLHLTQDDLSARAEISVDMVSKIEAGSTGASFASIVKLARALAVDPAELFSPHIPGTAIERPKLTAMMGRLARLSDDDLDWLDDVLTAVLKHR